MTERDRGCRIKAAAPTAFRTYIRNYLETLLTNELLFDIIQTRTQVRQTFIRKENHLRTVPQHIAIEEVIY